MEELRELMSVSSVSEFKGDIKTLADLVNQNFSREEAKRTFRKTDQHFNVVYKSLKDRLMKGVLVNDFKDASKVRQRQFSIRRQYEESIFLIQSEHKIAGILSARACMHKAEKNGLFQIALDLSRELTRYYGTIVGHTKKYEYYAEKMEFYREELNNELQVERLYFELGFNLKKGKNINSLKVKIEELGQIDSKSYRFNYMYFELLTLWHWAHRNDEAFLKTCEDALEHFSHYNFPLPYVTKWSWYFQQVPFYLAKRNYAKAEQCLARCLEGPEKGSINWYLSWQFRAIYGFHTDKPMMVVTALKKVNSLRKKFRNDRMEENWLVYRAYLELLVKLDRIEAIGYWKLSRFLNSVSQSNLEKGGRNVSIIIIELMHYLVDKKYEKFSLQSNRLNDYIKSHLSDKKHIRAKLFLRMLQAVVRGGFVKCEVMLKGNKYSKALKNTGPMVSADVREVEIIPFEALWEMALGAL